MCLRCKRFVQVWLIVLVCVSVPLFAGASSRSLEKEAVEVESKAQTSVFLTQQLHVVHFDHQPVATYTGGVPGYAPTNPRVAKTSRLRMDSQAVANYRDYLRQERSRVLHEFEMQIGRELVVERDFDLSFHGVALRLTQDEARMILSHPQVTGVAPERKRTLKYADSVQVENLSVVALKEMVERQGGRVLFSFVPMLAVFALGLFGVALYAKIRRCRRASLWFVGAILMLAVSACGSSSSVRITWPDDSDTAPGVTLINAPRVWLDDGGTMGEGVVVGIIDTGISPHSPSFAKTGGDGYTHKNPRGRYYGVCDSSNTKLYNPNFPCNSKLIGAWALAPDNYNPVDFNGHGSHVAATAAGNFVRNAVVHAPSGMNITANISGVAPHANIISYNVAQADGSLSSVAIMAAIEQAIADEVDVINYSIGSSPATDPWQEHGNRRPHGDKEMLPFLGAREAGIWVATSAGNEGPGQSTLGDPAVAPWMNTVASSTHHVAYHNDVTLSGGALEELETLPGLGLSVEYGPAPVVYAGDYGDPLCKNNFTASFQGEIVICDRGDIGRAAKGLHVRENGGGGMILAEVAEGDASALLVDVHWLPATHISQPDGDRLKRWLQESRDQGETLMATLSGTSAINDRTAADMISGFSSRGDNGAVPSVIKPDMAAPGSSIFAPVVDGLGYGIYQGTSMASPHVAGVLALLKARHPHWSPAEAQSALMTTSKTDIRRNAEGDPATPFDTGAGRVDAWNAIHAALLLDESAEGYRNANPEIYWRSPDYDRGDPANINMPSLGQGACVGESFWTRILTNPSSQGMSWEVSVSSDANLSLHAAPQIFTLAPGQSQALHVYADCRAVAQENWAFGRIQLQEQDGRAPAVHLPVAVRAMTYHVPEQWEIETTLRQGSETIYRLRGTEVSSIVTWGLLQGTIVEESLESDPTPQDILNNDGGIYLVHFEVPVDAKALLIDLDSDDSKDLNLYVGRNESYESPEEFSASAGPRERITISAPEPGGWWIGVHNFEGGHGDTDRFRLQYAIVTADISEEMTESLNATPTPQASPFELDLDWDVPALEQDVYWYGAIELQMAQDSVIIPLRLGDGTGSDDLEAMKSTYRLW